MTNSIKSLREISMNTVNQKASLKGISNVLIVITNLSNTFGVTESILFQKTLKHKQFMFTYNLTEVPKNISEACDRGSGNLL